MLKNPLLAQAQKTLQDVVTDHESFDKIVKALNRTIYDEKIFAQLAKGLSTAQDPIKDAADGIVGVLGALAQKARGTMPQEPAMQAAFYTFIDCLDFMQLSGLLEVVNEQTLESATKTFIESLLPKIGLTPEKLGTALVELQEVFSDPQRVAAYQAAQKKGM